MSHWLVSRNKSRIQFHDQETHFAKRFKERIFTWFYFMSKFRPEYCHSPSMRNCSITGSHRPPSLSLPPPPPLVKNFFRSSRQFFGAHLYSWAEKYTVKQREYHEQERRTMTSRSWEQNAISTAHFPRWIIITSLVWFYTILENNTALLPWSSWCCWVWGDLYLSRWSAIWKMRQTSCDCRRLLCHQWTKPGQR